MHSNCLSLLFFCNDMNRKSMRKNRFKIYCYSVVCNTSELCSDWVRETNTERVTFHLTMSREWFLKAKECCQASRRSLFVCLQTTFITNNPQKYCWRGKTTLFVCHRKHLSNHFLVLFGTLSRFAPLSRLLHLKNINSSFALTHTPPFSSSSVSSFWNYGKTEWKLLGSNEYNSAHSRGKGVIRKSFTLKMS